MRVTYLDDIEDCRVCGAPLAGSGTARGLCGRDYRRAYKTGTLEQYPLRPTPAPEARDVDDIEDVPALDLSWQIDALCAETDPEMFFPEKGQPTKPAKSTCAQCLVRAECLDYALSTGERFGVWGGLSERERRRLLGMPDDSEEASAA